MEFTTAAETFHGRVVETDADDNIIYQSPEDPGGNLNALTDSFKPHGPAVDWDKNMFSSLVISCHKQPRLQDLEIY